MKNTIMCCISCILPCGSLDVIRIVHSNGHVEELSGAVKASDIMKAHPKHILKKPSTSSAADAAGDPSSGACAGARIVIVPPDANLQRGKIYFLMPLPAPAPAPEKSRPSVSSSSSLSTSSSSSTATTTKTRNKKRKEKREKNVGESRVGHLIVSTDRYLNDILSEKLSRRPDRRRRRVAVWRPHLDSISESITD